ncbi:MAG: hypothetical protein IT430_17970 [Phycisphaerales bacterium]|nr:hypothetical protein [Phycisphaerales bacterium]
MKRAFRRIWARSPRSLRIAAGKTWRVRGWFEPILLGEKKVNARLAATNLFFLLGSGRCGTLFLSSLLAKDPQATVRHEPRGHPDMESRPRSRREPAFADYYIQHYRKYVIYRDIVDTGKKTYGEVSSPLRCLGGALHRAFPHAHMMVLARDGRDTVRSALNRQMGRGFQASHDPVRPLPGDAFHGRWASMSHFEKVCWWWMDAYRTLLRDLPEQPIIQFNRTLKEYDYLKTNVLDPIGLHISEETWTAHKARKSNNSAEEYRVPHWRDWTDAEKAFFDEVCGPTMERLGFPRGQWS